MSRRRGLVGGAAAVLALVAVLLLSNPRQDPYDRPPLDPRSTGPDGTAALVALLRAEGAEVRVGGLPAPDDDVALQLSDTLSGGPADDLATWVDAGGTLVVADPFAALAPPAAPQAGLALATDPAACTLDAAAEVDEIAPGLPLLYDARGTTSCFGTGTAAALVAVRRGDGTVVGLSGVDPLLNDGLGRADSAVLAVALLVPAAGARVRVLDPGELLSDEQDVGDGTVLGALPLRGSQAVTQLVIAFVACGLILGRRLGRPVAEELPVPLPASDLVLASGLLLDRNGDAADAAERLRRRARRDLGVGLGLGPDPAPDVLADALRAAGVDPALVHGALLAPVVDEDGLVATATRIDQLRARRSGRPDPTDPPGAHP